MRRPLQPRNAGGNAREPVQHLQQRLAAFTAPFEGQRQQQRQAHGTRFGLAKRQALGICQHRGVVGADGVDGAVEQAGAQGIAVTLGTQWRVEPVGGVEEAHVHVGQVQVVDGDIGRERQTAFAGLPHQFHPGSRRQPAQVHTAAHRGHQFDDGVQRDGFGHHRVAGQAQPRGEGTGVHHATTQPRVRRVEPYGVAV